jgi:N-acetylglucosamine-6-sulfatase
MWWLPKYARISLAVALAILVVGAVGAAPGTATPHVSCRPARACLSARAHRELALVAGSRRPTRRPNVVFVLTDDLSMNLLPFMPHVLAMQHAGLTFNDYFVTDSLCCPSRASILTGNFPHDTGILDNFGPHGGFPEFYRRHEAKRTFAIHLQRAGYLTALMGKYLNGYMNSPDGQHVRRVPANYVPPGWSEWDAAGWGYPEFDYRLNEDRRVKWFGKRPSDYLTDVISRRGTDFINRAVRTRKPFFLELSTFAPHRPYVPAPRNCHDYAGLTAPEQGNFDVVPTNAPRWLAGRAPLTGAEIQSINSVFKSRAQAVEAVDEMIGRLEHTLARDGIAKNTYVVFSSDNGLHTGEYRLMPGKMTAFDTDIHVPLVVVGPGVPAGATTDALASNIDLAKTFAAIGRTGMDGDGHSLLSVFHGRTPGDWRNAILVEHHGRTLSPQDPDYQTATSGDPPTYQAMRTKSFLYVEYGDGGREFYDLRTDPLELDNVVDELSQATRSQLHSELAAIHRCHGGRTCWTAMHVAIPSI